MPLAVILESARAFKARGLNQGMESIWGSWRGSSIDLTLEIKLLVINTLEGIFYTGVSACKQFSLSELTAFAPLSMHIQRPQNIFLYLQLRTFEFDRSRQNHSKSLTANCLS